MQDLNLDLDSRHHLQNHLNFAAKMKHFSKKVQTPMIWRTILLKLVANYKMSVAVNPQRIAFCFTNVTTFDVLKVVTLDFIVNGAKENEIRLQYMRKHH